MKFVLPHAPPQLGVALITLKIHHKTAYRYHTAVSLGPHRLMLRPRESRDLRLISSRVTVTPDAVLAWAHDVFGNAVATVTFQGMSTHIAIDSVAELQLDAVAWPVFDIAASAIFYPFRYSGPWRSHNIPTRRGGCEVGHSGSCGAIRQTHWRFSRA